MPGTLPTRPEPRLPIAGDPARLPPVAELALSDLRGLFWRQRWVLLGCLALSVGAVMAYTWWTRPVYQASSMVRFEHEQVNLPQLVEQLTTESRISTEMEVLQGRSAADAVIDSLGLRASLVSPRRGRVTTLFPTLWVAAEADTGTLRFKLDGDSGYAVWREGNPAGAVYAPLGERATVAGVTLALSRAAVGEPEIELHIASQEDALRDFKQTLKVSRPARDADLIEVAYRAGDPEVAARVANYLAEYLIASRQTELERRTGLAVNFLRNQVDSVRAELKRAEDTLQAYRTRAQAVDPAEQARTQVARLATLEADRAGLESERAALAALMEKIRFDSAASPDGPSPYRRLLGFPTILKNQLASELLGSLTVLENERSALLRRRTWLDPDVVSLTARIDDLDAQLKGIATSYLEGLGSQVAGLEQTGRQFGRSLDSLPRIAIQTARLQREATILQELYGTMQTRLKEAEIVRAMQDPAVRVVDRAFAAERPLRPRPKLNLALALIMGTMLGLSVSLGREMSDKSVRSRSDALLASGLPVLGAIPRVHDGIPRALRKLGRGRKLKTVGEILRSADQETETQVMGAFGPPASEAAAELAERLVIRPDAPGAYTEAFNQLQANLALAFEDQPLKVLVFTSPLPGEGKTLTAINYALTAAARGKKVLLIDADTRCGVVNQVFGCSRQPGFTELLGDKTRLEDGVRAVIVDAYTSFALLPTGGLLTGPSRELTVERIRQTLTAMRGRFDVVVIDSPPVNILADAALLGSAADGVILVARAGKTRREALSFAMDQLTAARAPVIGTLLNDIDLRRQQYDDGAYRYLAEVEKYHATLA